MRRYAILLCCCLLAGVMLTAQVRYSTSQGAVVFLSDAPLEHITATSRILRGIVDPENYTFAFTIDITSFQGFNSPLQRIHFNENYMESDIYPMATFAGKFIEEIDLMSDGIHEVRVKGKLKIHGVEKERIIKCTVRIDGDVMHIDSEFTVLLEDHAIRIPKVVQHKIAKVVTVTVNASLTSAKS